MTATKKVRDQVKTYFMNETIGNTRKEIGVRAFNKYSLMLQDGNTTLSQYRAALGHLVSGTSKLEKAKTVTAKNQAKNKAIVNKKVEEPVKIIEGTAYYYFKCKISKTIGTKAFAINLKLKTSEIHEEYHNMYASRDEEEITMFDDEISILEGYLEQDLVFKEQKKLFESADTVGLKTVLYYADQMINEPITTELNRKLKSGNDYNITSKYQTMNIDVLATSWNDFLVSNQPYPDKCWLNALLMLEGKLMKDKRTRYTKAIIEELYTNYLQLNTTNDSDGLTSVEIIPLFEQLNIGYSIYDFKFNILAESSKQTNLYFLIKNKHVYGLNENIRSLSKKEFTVKEVKLSSNFGTKKRELPDSLEMICSLDDLVKVIKSVAPKPNKTTREDKEKEGYKIHTLIYPKDMNELYEELLISGYDAKISTSGFSVERITIIYNRNIFNINASYISAIFGTDNIVKNSSQQLSNYKATAEVCNKAWNTVFAKKFRSDYNEDDKIALKMRTRPISFNNNHNAYERCFELDVNKFHAYIFSQVTKAASFNHYDIWQPYENQIIQQYDLCMIETEEHMIETQNICMCYGKNLKHYIDPKILSIKRASNVYETNFAQVVKDVYGATGIETWQKKDIINILIGCLEKTENKREVSAGFKSRTAAIQYMRETGGIIHPISKKEGSDDKYWMSFVTKTYKQELNNGFCYVKELIMQEVKFFLKNAWNLLTDNGIPIRSIKTDALLIPFKYLEQVQTLLKVSDKIGDWKIEFKQCPSMCKRVIQTFEFNPKKLIAMEHIKITDERNFDMDMIKTKTLILGACAGAGKTYICEKMKNPLFVCPTQKLKEDRLGDAVTTYEFFGMNLESEAASGKINDEKYDTIVFEEIHFNSMFILRQISNYMKVSSKVIVANGDAVQLRGPDSVNYVSDYSEYMHFVMGQMFDNVIILQENKRCKSEKDKLLSIELRKDIFENVLTRREIVNKYFKITNKKGNAKNLCYTNSRCKTVSEQTRKILNKQADFEVGERLICKKYRSGSDIKNNCTYTIQEIKGKLLILSDYKKNKHAITLTRATDDFIFDYARTVHASQGSTIRGEKVTIFEWEHPRVTAEWFYVACTRSDSFEDVLFYDEVLVPLDNAAYYRSKIRGYKYQDEKAKRVIDEAAYITVQWLEEQNHLCVHCNEHLDETEITADRIDFEKPHSINNCNIACLYCNIKRLNRFVSESD